MGLSDITGVLSRYFVVGFFLPAYIALIALWLSASSGFIPNVLEDHGEGTQLLILGGVALVAAMALSGLNYPLTRLVEGYPLLRVRDRPLLGAVTRLALAIQRRSYNKLHNVADDADALAEGDRAAWLLDQLFPRDPSDLLPTRIGNAIRAFEQHANTRWGLDGVTIWPRVEALLDSDERELHVDAKIDLYVFLNAAVGAGVVGICLVVDKAVHSPGSDWTWPVYAVPFVAAYALYRASIGPAIRWGDAVRASIDLHRLELYERLGIRAPTSHSDEHEMATPINQLLLYGERRLADDLWRVSGDDTERNGDAAGGNAGLLRRLKNRVGRVL